MMYAKSKYHHDMHDTMSNLLLLQLQAYYNFHKEFIDHILKRIKTYKRDYPDPFVDGVYLEYNRLYMYFCNVIDYIKDPFNWKFSKCSSHKRECIQTDLEYASELTYYSKRVIFLIHQELDNARKYVNMNTKDSFQELYYKYMRDISLLSKALNMLARVFREISNKFNDFKE